MKNLPSCLKDQSWHHFWDTLRTSYRKNCLALVLEKSFKNVSELVLETRVKLFMWDTDFEKSVANGVRESNSCETQSWVKKGVRTGSWDKESIFSCGTESLRKVSRMVFGLVFEVRSQIFRVRHSLWEKCQKWCQNWFLRQRVKFFVWDTVLEKSVKNSVRTGPWDEVIFHARHSPWEKCPKMVLELVERSQFFVWDTVLKKSVKNGEEPVLTPFWDWPQRLFLTRKICLLAQGPVLTPFWDTSRTSHTKNCLALSLRKVSKMCQDCSLRHESNFSCETQTLRKVSKMVSESQIHVRCSPWEKCQKRC